MSPNGTILNFSVYGPTLNDLAKTADSAIGSGVNLEFGGGQIIFEDDIVTYNDTSVAFWVGYEFFGFVISDTGDALPEIGGVTFTLNAISYDTSKVTFDDNTVHINLAGQTSIVGDNFAFRVEFVPSEITLSSSSVTEKALGAIIGDVTAVDANSSDTHTFAVDDNRFEIVGGQLKLKDGIALDFNDAASVDVKVTVTDSYDLTYEETFSISVTDVIDLFQGGDGDEKLRGTAGNDILRGRGGDDKLWGYGGDDLLRSRGGNDKFWGGTGADTFVYSTGSRNDRIMDFETGIDTIDLRKWKAIDDFADLKSHAKNKNGDLWIVDGKDKLIIKDFSRGDLVESDFMI